MKNEDFSITKEKARELLHSLMKKYHDGWIEDVCTVAEEVVKRYPVIRSGIGIVPPDAQTAISSLTWCDLVDGDDTCAHSERCSGLGPEQAAALFLLIKGELIAAGIPKNWIRLDLLYYD